MQHDQNVWRESFCITFSLVGEPFFMSVNYSHHAMYHHAQHPLYASPQKMAQHGPQLHSA